MITKEFELQYNNLNPEQKEAVDQIEGAVMVVAGPGTGKTKTLTLRIANILLKTQLNPENILALTFTEAAAHEMRKRLLDIIGHDAYRVDITTFHSFANNFIKRHQEEFSHIISAESINEIEQLEIIDQCIDELPLKILKPLGDLSYYIKPSLQIINKLKQENVSPSIFEKGILEFEKDLLQKTDLYHTKGAHKGKMKSIYRMQLQDVEKNKELVQVYSLYVKKLLDSKKYDYNDMLLEVIKKLEEHEYLLQYLQEKYQYFLIDENQDTNASQNKIVELLTNFFDNPNLFIVGDEKQAIFRFQGATLSNFFNFRKKYPDAKLINLTRNYRSTKNILDATYHLISHNPKSEQILSEEKALEKHSSHEEEEIILASLPSQDAEYTYVSQKIKQLLKKTPAHEIAVLVRNNRDIDPFVRIFDSEKIPYIVEADNNILDDLEIQKQIMLLRAISSPNNFNIQRVMLLDCFKIKPLDVFKINRYIFDKKKDVWEVLSDQKILEDLDISDKKSIEDFVNLFMGEDGFVKICANTRFDTLFVDVLNRSQLMQVVLKKTNGQEILSRMTRLYDEVKKLVQRKADLTVNDFIKYIDLLETHKISLKSNTNIIPKNSVRLMTVHRSKGQEFDYTFIVNAFDTHWGNKPNRGAKFHIPWDYLSGYPEKDLQIDDNADERRLFYVAMTRARKNVFIAYSVCSEDGRDQIPSQFIAELPYGLIKNEDLSKFESYFSTHQQEILNIKKIEKESFMTKEYAVELFRRQGLSVTALNNYLECPWKFFFINLIRIPEKIDNSSLFGSAMHFTLNQFIVSLKKERKIDKSFVLNTFEEQMKLLPFNESERQRFIDRGVEALNGYFDEQMKFWTKDLETEIDIRGIQINDHLFLNGKIDMLIPVKNNIFDVVDFKTGKPKSRNVIEGSIRGGNGNYKRQLVFYKILLDRYRNGFYQMRNGIIEFVEPNDSGKYKREIFEIDKKESDELLEIIIKSGEEISNLTFWDKECDESQCEYCDYRRLVG